MRTTSEAVKGVLLQDYDARRSPDLGPFIASASAIVTRVASLAAARSYTHTPEELELVERWLSAHMYCRTDKPFSSKGTQGASASFQGQSGMALDGSYYGQTAVTLDGSGMLNALGKRSSAAGIWLGVPL